MNLGALNEPRPGRWQGVCAGAYFTAGAAYVANALVMAVVYGTHIAVPLMFGGLAVACGVIGVLVLAEKGWMLKGAVVAAGAFSTIHLVGLVFLLFDDPPTTPILVRTLQWQLGAAFLFVWLCVLATALWLNRKHGNGPTPAPSPSGVP